MSRKYDEYQLVWNDITIAIRYCEAWLSRGIDGFNIAHLEIRAAEPERARLPMTETGYYSHFLQHDEVMAHGGPVGYVEAWLEHDARSEQWLEYLENSRQGSLF